MNCSRPRPVQAVSENGPKRTLNKLLRHPGLLHSDVHAEHGCVVDGFVGHRRAYSSRCNPSLLVLPLKRAGGYAAVTPSGLGYTIAGVHAVMERSTVTFNRKAALLERIMLCATSALASVLATLSIARYLRKKQRVKSRCEPWHAAASPEQDAERREKQLLRAIARVKELEAALSLVQLEKEELLGEQVGAASELAAAARVEKDLKHELGKVKFAAKELQDNHRILFKEKEAALAKAKALQKEKETLEHAVADAKSSMSGVQRSLAAQTTDRKAAERQVKQLQLDISAAQASKARIEANCMRIIKDLEQKLAVAEGARKTAEQQLDQHKAAVAPTRRKIEAFAQDMSQLHERYQQAQQLLRDAQGRIATEVRQREVLEPRLANALRRIRELEVELKVTRETVRAQMKTSSSRSSMDAPQCKR